VDGAMNQQQRGTNRASTQRAPFAPRPRAVSQWHRGACPSDTLPCPSDTGNPDSISTDSQEAITASVAF